MSPVQRRAPDADGEAASERPARADGASFAGAIVGRPGRPPVFLVVFLVAVAGLVLVGLGGGDVGGAPATQAPIAASSPTPTPTTSPTIPPVVFEGPSPLSSPGQAPIVASEAGSELALRIRRHPETMFVHGDVHPSGVTWVFVNLINAEGRIAAWTSVSVPGGTGPRPSGKPALRFDVELALPDWADGPLWLQATAYGASGSVVAQEQLGVWPDGSPMVGSHDRVPFGAPSRAPR